MADLKTQPTSASVDTFLSEVVDDTRRQDCLTLLGIMKRATGMEPKMWGSSMVGFGSYHYKYASGHEGNSFLAGFSPRKQALTLYLMGGVDQHERLAKLGKYKTGKGCLYIKRLSDVDLAVLEELVVGSVDQMKRTHG